MKRGPRARPASIALVPADAYPIRTKALAEFEKTGSVAAACKTASVSRQQWDQWIVADPSFGMRVMEIEEANTDVLEAQAISRAKADSDSLLMFLLKARRPEKYREKHKIEVVHPKVVDNLLQTVAVIREECDHELAKRIFARLDSIWDNRR